jgi:PAS domain S-box-containing protein
MVITREQMSEALIKGHEFVSAVLDTIECLVVVMDTAGQILYFNKACERLTGYTFEEVKGEPIWDRFLIPEDVDPVKTVFKELSSGQFPNRHENYWLTKEGRRRLIMWSNTALLGDSGPVEYVIGTGIDVTERKQAEIAMQRAYDDVERRVEERTARLVQAYAELKKEISERERAQEGLIESERRFRAFMDNNPAVAYIKNESGQHIYGNQTLFDIFETSADKFIGTTTRDFFPADIARRIEAYDSEVLSNRMVVEMEAFCEETRRRRRWWKEIKFPFTDNSGETMIGGLSFNITELKQAEEKLRKAFNEIKELKDRIEQENLYLREEVEVKHIHEEIIGGSEPVRKMLSRAEQVAATDSTVLILGETGTGKELLARAIHRMSPRKNRPMIIVNCAALPSSLIESEMFGCEKGAFTGALSRRFGRFEVADGSTIFLDEVGELSTALQMKLLRVLESGQFERLGSNETIKVDVRVIAATNRDLERSVREGSLRRDLYYRLNVFPITVPPLRERLEDVELLVWAFVREFGERMGKRVEKIPRNIMEALKRFPWEGNVRELRNVIEKSMIVTKGTTLNVQLPRTAEVNQGQDMSLKDVERNHILKILQQTGWRVRGRNGAAELLGLKESTLRSRMKKLGIQRRGGQA